MSLNENKAGGTSPDADDYNAVVDAVVALQAGGGGGSQTVEVVTIPFSFDMSGISDLDGPGVASGWTPNAGDYFFGQICSITTAFDGTNPNLWLGKQGFGGSFPLYTPFQSVNLETADYLTSPPTGWLLPNFSPALGTVAAVCADAVEQYMYVLNSDDGSDPENAAGEGILTLLIIPA